MQKEMKRIIIVAGICLLLLVLAVMLVIFLTPKNTTPPTGEPVSTGEQVVSDPSQTDPAKPTETDSSQPAESDPTKPTETDPTKPTETDPTKPTEADPTKPTESDPTKPTETDPTNPTETDPTKPTETDPTNPSDPTDPTEKDPTKPTEPKPTDPTDPTDPTNPDPTDPIDPPPVVEIPDEDAEEEGLQFPCQIPGYDLEIEKLAPYTGLFVEDGTNTQVENVAMLLIHNKGTQAVEYTEITVNYAEETLLFHITALPAGESMVVQEKDCKTIPEGVPLTAKALVVRRAQMEIAPEISVTDNGDNSLTIKNLTTDTIPTVRVFYKHYMEQEDLFVGGIAFTVRITGLAANDSVVIRPSHYMSQTSRVVMAQIYDS